MTDPIIVLRKLMILREHLGRARARRPGSAAELAADTLLQDAIAMSLFVAIQEAKDASRASRRLRPASKPHRSRLCLGRRGARVGRAASWPVGARKLRRSCGSSHRGAGTMRAC